MENNKEITLQRTNPELMRKINNMKIKREMILRRDNLINKIIIYRSNKKKTKGKNIRD